MSLMDLSLNNSINSEKINHSLRVSAATALAEKGATALQLQNFGGWKSIAVAEGYIRESAKTKKDIALLLSGAPKEDTTKQDATGPFLLSGTTEKDSTNQDATDPPSHQPKLNRVLLILFSPTKPIVLPKLWVILLTKPSMSIMVVSCIFKVDEN
ncbi:hypothetical protein ACTFIZ_004836 [Dictyostelium cf. discoideum]